jgi:peptide chain release factor 1
VKKLEPLFSEISEKISDYNKQIATGYRLTDKESEDLSKATFLYPLLFKYHSLSEDLRFAQDQTATFDKNFTDTIEFQLKELETQIGDLIKKQSKKEVKEFILEMRAGAGGGEASLFCKDLFNAYSKYLTSIKTNIEIIEISETESGGYSTIIAEIKSKDAYELLKNEGGVHRVQRVPKTENSGRIHTSTISVAIVPILEKSNIEINPQDIRVDVYRSSGHGGQSVNTTDSAVRITHIPSGLVVTCQNTKSQIKNKEMAMKVLLARLEKQESDKLSKNIQDIRNKQIQNSDRSEKIRTYNFLQDRITDHRVKLDFSGIPKFLQGEIKPILEKINDHFDSQLDTAFEE